ncbi:MAG: hypothetical protein PUB89_06990, partial [Oscillospiraceae bacterium]|nr:hypothetical protein [Oscillospiraceae bacterium]
PAKTKIDSNKLTYEFSTLTNNCGVDKYIPFGMSEESAPNWLISSVNPSWKYYVDIYVTPNETILDKTNEITISFEEDNWFYAPNGGVATSEVFDYSALYLPESALKVLAKRDALSWEEMIEKNILPRKLREVLTYYYYEEDECHYLNMGQKGFDYKLVSGISTASTFVGLGCLFGSAAITAEKFASACSVLGNAATVSGAAFTVFSPHNVDKEDFEYKTENCIKRINPDNVNLSLHNYDKFGFIGERYDCQEWINNGYVHKYYYAGSNDAYRIIRADDFKPF